MAMVAPKVAQVTLSLPVTPALARTSGWTPARAQRSHTAQSLSSQSVAPSASLSLPSRQASCERSGVI